MKTIIADAFSVKQDRDNLIKAAQIISDGGLVAFPTETVYGLGANALDASAVKKIFLAKGRPQDNPLIVHVSSLEMVKPLVTEISENAKKLMEKFWPGPLTIIMKRTDKIPDAVSAGLDTVAVRMPSDEIARELIAFSNLPIAAPSANLSGSPSPTASKHVISDLNGRIDMILNSHDCAVGVESTVISLAGEKPRLLRPGFITPEQLSSVLGEIDIDDAVFRSVSNDAVVNAPGMKYKHYSPKASVKVLKGSFEKYAEYVNAHKTEHTVAMCFNCEGKYLNTKFVEYGNENDSAEQAQKLFDALREVDKLNADIVFARCPDQNGIGLAVSNRLFKAAGFEVIEL